MLGKEIHITVEEEDFVPYKIAPVYELIDPI
jgi:hypothetical protein